MAKKNTHQVILPNHHDTRLTPIPRVNQHQIQHRPTTSFPPSSHTSLATPTTQMDIGQKRSMGRHDLSLKLGSVRSGIKIMLAGQDPVRVDCRNDTVTFQCTLIILKKPHPDLNLNPISSVSHLVCMRTPPTRINSRNHNPSPDRIHIQVKITSRNTHIKDGHYSVTRYSPKQLKAAPLPVLVKYQL